MNKQDCKFCGNCSYYLRYETMWGGHCTVYGDYTQFNSTACDYYHYDETHEEDVYYVHNHMQTARA